MNQNKLIRHLPLILYFALLVLISMVIISCSGIPNKYKIITALTNNNYKVTNKMLRSMKKKYETSNTSQKCDYHYFKGCYLYSTGMLEEAEREFDFCLELNNAYLSALYSRAELKRTCKKDYYSAIEDYEQLIELMIYAEGNEYFDQNSIITLHSIVGCPSKITRHNQDRKFTSKSMRSSEFERRFYGRLINACMNVHEYRKAISSINNYLIYYPEVIGFNRSLATCYFNLSEYRNSIIAFKEYLKQDKSNYYPYYMIGVCYFKLEDFEKCVDQLTISLKKIELIDFDELESYTKKENDEQLTERYETTITGFSESIESILLHRARSYGKLKQYTKAISDLSRILTKNPEYVDALYYRGYFYNYNGEQQSSLDDFLKVIQLDTNRNTVNYSIALIYDSFGEFNQAIKYYEDFTSNTKNKESGKYQTAKKRLDDLKR